MRLTRILPLLAGALLPCVAAGQTAAPPLDSATLAGFRWRTVGPANVGGRVADIVGIPSPSKTFYVAAAGGGIWKTTNAGTTFRPIFDHERVVSMGALAIAPSDTNIVWAGTGEQNSRNSVTPGGGIYKSTDGGMTWQDMGLHETQQIARIVVHPTNPNIVYVAALGHLWGPNKERGLYKTTDGGKSWQLAKYIDERTGFVDVALDPSNPNIVWAASYQRVRGPWFLLSGGPGSGLWKSTDGGTTWSEVKGGGFPSTTKGRIGLAISPSNPKIMYALVEADSMRGANHAVLAPASDSAGARPKEPRKQRLLSGLYRSEDGGATWRWMNDRDVRPFYYSQVRVDPERPDRVYWSSTPVNFSDDGGKTVRNATQGIHVDHHAMWIDPKDGQHFVVGDDGGVSQTWDRGGNYEFLNVLPIAQFYEVSYNMAVPYRVCGGLQDNGSWCGPSRKRSGSITNRDWYTVGGGDGFFAQQDPTDTAIVYSESQGGNIGRLDIATGERFPVVKPSWRPVYQQYEDSIIVVRGDTTKPAPAAVRKRLEQFRQQQRADSVALDLRFNWNTPYLISPHNPRVLYVGGNRVLKSVNRGDSLYPISPDLSTRDMPKILFSMDTTGGITNDATGAETYGTVTALAESPVSPGVLYAGTDDGNVWLTRNDGATWENLTTHFPGLPAHTYVSRIEPSHFDTATVYVAFDNHRVNDFTPYVYASTDFGRSFRSIVGNLPSDGPAFVHVVREDPHNRDLLFVGTDVAAFVSRDRGSSWQRFSEGMPTVPVYDLQIHPRDGELIAATHGRGIWIVDINPLEQWSDSVTRQVAFLFSPRTAYQFGQHNEPDASDGHQLFEAASAPYGADIAYWVAPNGAIAAAGSTNGAAQDGDSTAGMQAPASANASDSGANAGRQGARGRNGRRGRGARATVHIAITNAKGDTLQTLTGPGTPGLHHVTWNFRGKEPPRPKLSPAGLRDSVQRAHKITAIIDSLEREGTAPRAQLERIKTMLLSGGGFGGLFGGRQGAQPGQFAERPGESPLPAATPRRAGADTAAGAERGGGEQQIDRDLLGDVFDAIRAAGVSRGGFFGRGGAPLVETGDYLVTLTAGNTSLHQLLRVERVGVLDESAGDGLHFGEEELDP
ncbi:MAG TPA: hypothetical protein VFK13_04665 [Gemmatimonadaceae bacterium]|nr:hypothetical protein [Gemmatimonadaceae bacterium]